MGPLVPDQQAALDQLLRGLHGGGGARTARGLVPAGWGRGGGRAGWRGWAWPVIALGRNAITAFVLSTVVYLSICPVPFNSNNFSIRGWIYQNVFGSWANPYNASLGFAVAYVLLWIVVTAVLSRRRV